VQAQNVMRKWNITSKSHSPCTEALEEYGMVFNSPLGLQQRKAIHALFVAHCPPPVAGELDIEP
jgi:hypothetical protein